MAGEIPLLSAQCNQVVKVTRDAATQTGEDENITREFDANSEDLLSLCMVYCVDTVRSATALSLVCKRWRDEVK